MASLSNSSKNSNGSTTLGCASNGIKIFSKGEKIKKLITDILNQNKILVDNHDIRWRDFGAKFRGKLKRDGSIVTKVMNEDSKSAAPGGLGKESQSMVELTNPREMKRLTRKIDDLIKWS